MHFDPSKHQNDARTKHAGICTKWVEITFLSDSCKFHFSAENLPSEKVFLTPLQPTQQLDLNFPIQ